MKQILFILFSFFFNHLAFSPMMTFLDNPAMLLTNETDTCTDICFKNAASSIVIDGTAEATWSSICEHPIENIPVGIGDIDGPNDCSGYFQITWDATALYLFIQVTDDDLQNDSGGENWNDDGIEIYIDGDHSGGMTYMDNDHQFRIRWNDPNNIYHYDGMYGSNPTGILAAQTTSETNDGYNVEVQIDWSLIGVTPVGDNAIGVDVHIIEDDNGGDRDSKLTWERVVVDEAYQYPSHFGSLLLNDNQCICSNNACPAICLSDAAPTIDGLATSYWTAIQQQAIDHLVLGSVDNATDCSGYFQTSWDATALYFFIHVEDDILINDSGTSHWQDDGIEIYIDGDHSGDMTYMDNDHQFRIRWNDLNNIYHYDGNYGSNPAGILAAQMTSPTNDGYNVEVKIDWSLIGVSPSANSIIGLDVHIIDDDDGGDRDANLTWEPITLDLSYENPSVFGDILLGGDNCSSTITCLTDSLALVALYNATSGMTWANSWDLDAPMNTWHGVGLNANGCVQILDLPNNQLNGIIPTEIGDLSNLVVLRLSNNQLSGLMPTELGNLSYLVQLDLSHNQLNGNIPSTLGQVQHLRHLLLSHNQLNGAIPAELADLHYLFYIYLNDNALSGCFPETFDLFCSKNHDFRGNVGLGDFDDFCVNGTGGCL